MLKVELLGKFSVEVDGNPIDAWPRRDAAQLLKLLATQVNHSATRHYISEALWLELDAATKPKSRLSNALYVLRKALEPERATHRESRYVTTSEEMIALSPQADIWIDIDHFERLLDIGMVEEASTSELTQAIALYQGPLLPCDEGQPWSNQPRLHLEQRYIGALRALSHRHRRNGNDEAAIGALQRLTRALPTEEASHRELIQLFVRAGRHAEAQRQFEQCRAALASELGVAPDASTREALRPVQDHAPAVGSAGSDDVPPAARTLEPARFNPPLLLRTLVDREREVTQAGAVLRSGCRLLTLVGPAGVGKTQLAIRIANELRETFDEGACYVSLGEISDTSAVAGAIGRALGLKQTPALDWNELLKRQAAQRHVLLVLDNFEHLLGAAPLVCELIAAGERLSILCTSRAALNVAGETLLSVAPLRLPPTGPHPLHELEEVASVALFVQRAQAAEPAFRLTEANAASVVALCHRLDGLPLAIELAAARVKLFGTEELQRRLGDSFDLLHRGRRDSPERHHSLQAVLLWGYQLLPPDVQAVFNRLGLFAGSFTLASARGTFDADDSDGDTIADALELLLEHHLLVLADPAPHHAAERRYRMLQTVRAFALDQLLRSPTARSAHERFARYWVEEAERIDRDRLADRAEEACATFEVEHGNFEAAVGWAARHDGATAHRFVAALAPLWAMRGFSAEGRRWVRSILPMRRDRAEELHANAAFAAAGLLLNVGHYGEAIPHAAFALRHARLNGPASRVVHSLRLLGHLNAMMGRWSRATLLLRHALQHSLALDDSVVAACRNSLGTLLRHRGEYAEANECYKYALAQIDVISPAMASGLLFNMSVLARLRGDYAKARDLCSEAVARGRASRDLRKLGCVLVDYGELMLLVGCLDEGAAALEEALEINKRVDDRFLLGCVLQQKGAAAVLRGHTSEGREWLEQSLQVHREADCGDQADITLLWLTRACWLEGSGEAAASAFDRLLRLGTNIRHYLLPAVLEEGAKLLRHRGQLRQAWRALDRAEAMRQRFTLPRPPAEEPATQTEAAALRAELGALAWDKLAAEAPLHREEHPLRLLEDSLAAVSR